MDDPESPLLLVTPATDGKTPDEDVTSFKRGTLEEASWCRPWTFLPFWITFIALEGAIQAAGQGGEGRVINSLIQLLLL